MFQSQAIFQTFSFWSRFVILLAHDPIKFRGVSVLIRTVSLLQTLALILSNIHFEGSEDFLYVSTMTRTIQKLATGFTSAGIQLNASSSNLGIKIAVYVYFLLLLMKLVAVAYQAWTSSPKPRYTSLFSILLELHAEALFYPINFILTELIVQIYYDTENAYLVPSLQIVGFCVLLTLSLGIALFKVLYCYSPVPLDKITNRKGSFHLIGILITKISLTLLWGFEQRNDNNAMSYKLCSGVIVLVISGLILIYTRLTLAEYDLSLMKVHTVYDASMVGISIIQLISLSKIQQGYIVGLLVLVTPLWIKLYLNSLRFLINSLTFQFNKINNAAYLAHVQILYIKLGENLHLNIGKDAFTRKNLMAKWIAFESMQTTGLASQAEDRDFYDYAEFMGNCEHLLIKLYEDWNAQNRENILILLCYLKVLIQSNTDLYLKAYHICISLLNKNIHSRDRVALYAMLCQIQRLDKIENSQNLQQRNFSNSLWTAYRAEQIYQDLKEGIVDYIQHKSMLWRLLKVSRPDMYAVANKASYLDRKDEEIKGTWKRYESEFASRFPLAHLVYGIFKEQFMNSPVEGVNYLSKYFLFKQNKRIEEEKLLNHNGVSNYVTVMISGEKRSLGKVLSCSESLQPMFGYNHRELLSQNINMIMPRFFQEKHDKFILDFYNTGRSRIMASEDMLVFGKNQQNEIFPVTINLSIQPNLEQGIMYTALLTRIKNENQYIFFGENGEIQEMSGELKGQLNLDCYKKIKITDICREYITTSSKILERRDKQLETFENKVISLEIYKKVEFEKRIMSFRAYSTDSRLLSAPASSTNSFQYEVEMLQYTYCESLLNIMILKPVYEKRPAVSLKLNHINERTLERFDIEETEVMDSPTKLPKHPLMWKSRFFTEFETGISPTATFSPRNEATERTELFRKETTEKSSERQLISGQETMTKDITQKVKIQIASSLSKKTSNTARKRIINDISKIYRFPPVNKKKIALVSIFSLLLTVIGVVMAIVAYVVFRQSVQDIDYTISVIRTNFERLNAVCQVFGDITLYQAGADGARDYDVTDYDSALDKLDEDIDDMREQNYNLAEIMQTGEEDQQELFYEKSVRIWKNADLTDEEYYFNTFDAINLFVERLQLFYERAVNASGFQKDDNLQFVRQNLFNDLLISSEDMISVFNDTLTGQLDDRQGLLKNILILSIVVLFATGAMIVMTLHIDMKENKQIFSALVTINPSEIANLEIKLEYFSQALIEKQEDIISRKLYSLYSTKKKIHRAKFRADLDNYSSQRVLNSKIKDCLIIGFFLIIYAVIFFVKFQGSSSSLDDLISFNNRTNILYQTKYQTVIINSIMSDYMDFNNTVYIRNKVDGTDRRTLLNILGTNEYIIDAFTDSKGVYITAAIGAVFETTVCPYLVDFKGIDCEAATGGKTMGLIELIMEFYNELDFYERTMSNNFSAEQGKELYPSFTDVSLPKLNVILAAYTYIAEEMNSQSGDKIDNLLGKEPIYFGLELVGFYILSGIAIWIIYVKFISNRMICVIVKAIPYREVLRNHFLRHTVIRIFNKRAEFLKKDSLLSGIDTGE